MNATTADGILAIWNDCAPGREAEFEQWYQSEHLAERLAVPGFLFGRRHEASSGSPRYFTFYVTETPDVLASEAYLSRLNEPTPLTQRVMSGAFKNMTRTVCRRAASAGRIRGSIAVTVRFHQLPDRTGVQSVLESLARNPVVARAEFWEAVDPEQVAVAEEERLRGGDQKIAACLSVDTLRAGEADAIAADLSRHFPYASELR